MICAVNLGHKVKAVCILKCLLDARRCCLPLPTARCIFRATGVIISFSRTDKDCLDDIYLERVIKHRSHNKVFGDLVLCIALFAISSPGVHLHHTYVLNLNMFDVGLHAVMALNSHATGRSYLSLLGNWAAHQFPVLCVKGGGLSSRIISLCGLALPIAFELVLHLYVACESALPTPIDRLCQISHTFLRS